MYYDFITGKNISHLAYKTEHKIALHKTPCDDIQNTKNITPSGVIFFNSDIYIAKYT
jgi:hypothetical protein